MKLNSPASIATARQVFRAYNGSWTNARAAGVRDAEGVLVIPKRPKPAEAALNGSALRRRGDD